eukprot:TRINITY_DN23009_c0_g1_i1.p1 TRINITY_DN23009_c0_g1~~TRINITY_DN23009_c0_g1_i1.p1  ORF type:complete len:570 (+),score=115.33 TRINITY_DN23009_c0_g1_i1:215-1924(+)
MPCITYLGFNQDQSCMVAGTTEGFYIISTEDASLLHHEACGPVSVVEMLFQTSLVAFASGVRLTMWNTKERCSICELSFNDDICGVRMNHRRVAALLRDRIHILELKTMTALHVIDRAPSPYVDPSMSCLCAAHERGYLATPFALADGPMETAAAAAQFARPSAVGGSAAANAESSDVWTGFVTVLDTHTLKTVGTVLAHRCPIQAVALNPTGELLATSSTKGTVVRLFLVPAMSLANVFRRGTSFCRILGLHFTADSEHMCVSSSGGTVHIFRLSEGAVERQPAAVAEHSNGHAVSQPENRTNRTASSHSTASQSQTAAPAAAAAVAAAAADDAPIAASAGCREDEKPEGGEDDEFDDWQLIEEERPERAFQMASGRHPRSSAKSAGIAAMMSSKDALRTLSAISEFASETSRYAKSLLQRMPQPCREFVDAPRAFAYVHLDGEFLGDLEASLSKPPASRGRSFSGDGGYGALGAAASAASAAASTAPSKLATGAASVISGWLGGSSAQDVPGHDDFVACMLSRSATGSGEVTVASVNGKAQTYTFSLVYGGECTLRGKFSFLSPTLR